MDRTLHKLYNFNLYRRNQIDVDLYNVVEPFRSFILNTIRFANKHDITVVLSDKDHLPAEEETEGDIPCNGYFCEDSLTLSVACGKPFYDWAPVFVHESCHVDQWIEDDPAFEGLSIHGISAYDLLGLWLDHQIELTPQQQYKVLHGAMIVELNCERRAIYKIKKYGLPLDIKQYAQKANAYVYFYLLVGETRKWYPIKKTPYQNHEIVRAMPTDMDRSYHEIPKKIRDVMMKHLFPDIYYSEEKEE